MAAETENPSVFTLLSKLPGELRNAIWTEAFLDAVNEPRASLAPFKPGCWPLRGTEEEQNLELRFRPELLDVYMEIPLVYVNREARSVTVARSKKLGLKICTNDDEDPILIRPFETAVDVFFLASRQISQLIMEYYYHMSLPDILDRFFTSGAYVRAIALTEEVVREEANDIVELFNDHITVPQLLVIVNEPVELNSVLKDELEKHEWTVTYLSDGVSWNGEEQRFEGRGKSEYLDKRTMSRLEKAFRKLRFPFRPFEVRPVLARRRVRLY
jgi:hypothetical protein